MSLSDTSIKFVTFFAYWYPPEIDQKVRRRSVSVLRTFRLPGQNESLCINVVFGLNWIQFDSGMRKGWTTRNYGRDKHMKRHGMKWSEEEDGIKDKRMDRE